MSIFMYLNLLKLLLYKLACIIIYFYVKLYVRNIKNR